MKAFILILLFSATASIAAEKPSDIKFNVDKLKRTYPVFGRAFERKMKDPNGWKFSTEEYMKMLNGSPSKPRYYHDPKHGSNGGYDFA